MGWQLHYSHRILQTFSVIYTETKVVDSDIALFVNITIRAVNCLQLLTERFRITSHVLADQRKLHAGMPISLTEKMLMLLMLIVVTMKKMMLIIIIKYIILFMLRTMTKISNMIDSSRSVVVWWFSRRQIVTKTFI